MTSRPSSISSRSIRFRERSIAARRTLAIEKFRDELMQRGLIVTIRKTRGDDIDAACGQLAGQVTDRTIVRLGSKTFGLQVRA